MQLNRIVQTQQRLSAQRKEIIANMIHFLNQESESLGFLPPIVNPLDRVLLATGLDQDSLKKLNEKEVDEDADAVWKENFSQLELGFAPGFYKGVIRHCYIDYILHKKSFPNFQYLQNKIEKITYVQLTQLQLRDALRDIGFENRILDTKHVLLLEKHQARLGRIHYLRKILRYKQEKRPLVYIGALERLFPGHHRMILIQAGSENGFLTNSTTILKNKYKDNQKEMTQNHIPQFLNQLIPTLPADCVIILDNFYLFKNNKETINLNSENRKLKKWLRERNILYKEKISKIELYRLIKQHRPKCKRYVLDEKLIENNFEVLRLPKYNPDLNPFEIMYHKLNVYLNNIPFKNTDKPDFIFKKCHEWFNNKDRANEWKHCWKQICDWEEKYILKESKLDDVMDDILQSMEEDSEYNPSDFQSSSDNEGKEAICID